jgi:hypothetical protein
MKYNLKNITNLITGVLNWFMVSATVCLVWFHLFVPQLGYGSLIIPLCQTIWLADVVFTSIRSRWIVDNIKDKEKGIS